MGSDFLQKLKIKLMGSGKLILKFEILIKSYIKWIYLYNLHYFLNGIVWSKY